MVWSYYKGVTLGVVEKKMETLFAELSGLLLLYICLVVVDPPSFFNGKLRT